jgi:hypothetical protein
MPPGLFRALRKEDRERREKSAQLSRQAQSKSALDQFERRARTTGIVSVIRKISAAFYSISGNRGSRYQLYGKCRGVNLTRLRG